MTQENIRRAYVNASPIPKTSNVAWNIVTFAVWTFGFPNALVSTQIGIIAFFIPLLFILRVWLPLSRDYVHPRVSKGIYKSDKRFKTGSRKVGSYLTSDTSIRVPLEPAEISIYRVEGIIKAIILIVSYSFMYSTSQTAEYKLTNMTIREKIALIHEGDTLYKNGKFIYYYAVVNNSKNSYVEFAYDTSVSYTIFLGVDSIQTNSDTRSTMQKVKGSPEYRDFTPEYDVMFKVKPIVKPNYKNNEEFYRGKRVGKNWYVKPSDVNVGASRLNRLAT
jgi:hypothetical protein